MDLLKIINFGTNDTLYILGDAVDRGEFPIKCIQFIMNQSNIQMLMGNHELLMTDTVLFNGKKERWLGYNGGDITYKQLLELPESQQKEILDFVSSLPYFYKIKVRSKRFLLIHAGLELQGREYREPLTKTISRQIPKDMVWIRKEFYMQKALPSYTIVFGHTPTHHLHSDRSDKIWHDSCYKDKICIDCGCYGGGQLAALCRTEQNSICYSNTKVTYSRLSHKRLTLHIPDAADNVIPYEIYSTTMGSQSILKAKRLSVAMKLCTGSLETVADKLRYARLMAGLYQDELADRLGIDRVTLLRYENGQVSEENMQVDWLIQIASICGMDKYFCCSPYHVFLAEDAGKQIKRYRKSMGLTQKKFAFKLEVAVATVKRWERNDSKPPKMVWELVFSLNTTDT